MNDAAANAGHGAAESSSSKSNYNTPITAPTTTTTFAHVKQSPPLIDAKKQQTEPDNYLRFQPASSFHLQMETEEADISEESCSSDEEDGTATAAELGKESSASPSSHLENVSAGPIPDSTAEITDVTAGEGNTNRRAAHIASEQKRRQNINEGFEDLRRAIPPNPTNTDSKAMILRKATNYIYQLQYELSRLRSALLGGSTTITEGKSPPLPSTAGEYSSGSSNNRSIYQTPLLPSTSHHPSPYMNGVSRLAQLSTSPPSSHSIGGSNYFNPQLAPNSPPTHNYSQYSGQAVTYQQPQPSNANYHLSHPPGGDKTKNILPNLGRPPNSSTLPSNFAANPGKTPLTPLSKRRPEIAPIGHGSGTNNKVLIPAFYSQAFQQQVHPGPTSLTSGGYNGDDYASAASLSMLKETFSRIGANGMDASVYNNEFGKDDPSSNIKSVKSRKRRSQ